MKPSSSIGILACLLVFLIPMTVSQTFGCLNTCRSYGYYSPAFEKLLQKYETHPFFPAAVYEIQKAHEHFIRLATPPRQQSNYGEYRQSQRK